MNYKVLVDATDAGSKKYGDFTKYIHKALLRVGKKPAISYIIEAYPSNVEIVVLADKFSEQIEDFLHLVYPENNFQFVQINSVPLPKMLLMVKKYLHKTPFIYHNANQICEDKIGSLKQNWFYSSKLFGVYDHVSFWRDLPDITQFEKKEFRYAFDISTPKALERARKKVQDRFENLDKIEEATFIVNQFVVKFDRDQNLVTDKVHRARVLKNLVPKVHGSFHNFFKYEYVEGELYSQVVTPNDFGKFLSWCQKKLWTQSTKMSKKDFYKICYEFYYIKTMQRVKRMFEQNNIIDKETIINDEKIPPLDKLLAQIDFDWLSNTKQHRIHGDLVLENVIKTKNGYRLIDWRRDFGGDLDVGDIYYDLSKMNHNLTVNHKMIEEGHFRFEQKDNRIICDIFRSDLLVKCSNELVIFLDKEKLDKKKVQVLTAIIWLNMSPLHPTPKNFNKFLLYFGKYNLWRALKTN